jgi:hypothetical protein
MEFSAGIATNILAQFRGERCRRQVQAEFGGPTIRHLLLA